MAEFAGVASSMELFRISKFISVPIAAAVVWLIVVKGNYKTVEKVFLTASFFYIAYIIAGVLAHPNWNVAALSTLEPPTKASVFRIPGYTYMVIGIMGATIAPWMQFYLQASIVEKGVTERDYKTTRIDILIGSIFAVLVAAFIIIACAATLNKYGHPVINDAADAARALGPLAGKYASVLFGAGLFNASLFAASILPLSTAYTVCEGLGFESGLDKKFSEASVFYWLYTALVGAGAAVILLPRFPLLKMPVLSQVFNGVLLPFVLIFMLILINKTSLMGEHVNSRFFNWVAWGTAGVMIVLSILLVFQ
jgi:Mn2+/Fe2+ NRAMP family transporter